MDYNTNKTFKFISKANIFFCFCGVHDLWFENTFNTKFNKYFNKFVTCSLIIFLILEIVALFTRNDLTEKQSTDLYLLVPSHCIMATYYTACQYYKKSIKRLLTMLCIDMKAVYNVPEIERQMIKKSTKYSLAYLLSASSALLSYGFNAFMQVLFSGLYLYLCTDVVPYVLCVFCVI